MTTEKMNIHKALVELKTLDSRIRKAIEAVPYVTANKHSNSKINGIPADDYCNQVKESYQKVTDLIARRNAIKRAIVLSNASTKVNIGENRYTVAEAIEMKNHGLDYQKLLLARMTMSYKTAELDCNRNNGETLERKAEAHIASIYGSTDMKNASAEVQKDYDDFLKAQTYEIVDPLGAQDKIAEIDEFISNFMVEVDSALSVSNAITEITINY